MPTGATHWGRTMKNIGTVLNKMTHAIDLIEDLNVDIMTWIDEMPEQHELTSVGKTVKKDIFDMTQGIRSTLLQYHGTRADIKEWEAREKGK